MKAHLFHFVICRFRIRGEMDYIYIYFFFNVPISLVGYYPQRYITSPVGCARCFDALTRLVLDHDHDNTGPGVRPPHIPNFVPPLPPGWRFKRNREEAAGPGRSLAEVMIYFQLSVYVLCLCRFRGNFNIYFHMCCSDFKIFLVK